MPSSIAPGFIQIEYHSAYGAHVQTLPVNNINVDAGDPVTSTIDTWTAGALLWSAMVDDLVDELIHRYPSSVTLDRANLWSKPLPTDLPTFVASHQIGVVGDAAVPGYTKAAQETISARDTAGYIAKIVSLDMASGDNWDVQFTPTAAGVVGLFSVWTSDAAGWSSQAGFRPAIFIKATRTLNEALRRRYRQT